MLFGMTSRSALRGEGLWLRRPGIKRDIPGVESCKSLFFGVEVGEGVGETAKIAKIAKNRRYFATYP